MPSNGSPVFTMIPTILTSIARGLVLDRRPPKLHSRGLVLDRSAPFHHRGLVLDRCTSSSFRGLVLDCCNNSRGLVLDRCTSSRGLVLDCRAFAYDPSLPSQKSILLAKYPILHNLPSSFQRIRRGIG